jgi:hypothetical protein
MQNDIKDVKIYIDKFKFIAEVQSVFTHKYFHASIYNKNR